MESIIIILIYIYIIIYIRGIIFKGIRKYRL